MIKRYTSTALGPSLVVGLSLSNIRRLSSGRPIIVCLNDQEQKPGSVMLMYCAEESDVESAVTNAVRNMGKYEEKQSEGHDGRDADESPGPTGANGESDTGRHV